ncbi:ribosome biogenesis GTPase [Methanomicrobium sp. W14]|uniref:ribosome small subunit-dependent GTPase A n=1 Tax=Methanomicrobium sp. W14 TaxID=2817839 RepID=UPI001AEBA1BD|nr:ribosome small subunit-dependent GTPase A [Methanomicrobium sp. W14]MBP2133277.1 ribosome biogenesis GTPase [Methanomicrobium sp. W14]
MGNPNFFSGLNSNKNLRAVGWDDELEMAFSPYSEKYIPGRVSCRQRTHYEIYTEEGIIQAKTSGALKKRGINPAVGDFVVVLHQPEAGTFTIVNVLPRKTEFRRGAVGKDGLDQVIAANIDTVFIVTSAGADLNVRRLERYLALVYASGARPVIVINKIDLTENPDEILPEISPAAAKVPVVMISALNKTGIPLLDNYLQPGKTVALIGSSGVGKSTLTNVLLQDSVQDTCQVRQSDEKGRHKTTVRQLFVLNSGAVVIDNPGLREVGIGTAGEGLSETFADIDELARECRFSDCRHEKEPGCAVKKAVNDGILSEARLENYLKLRKELTFEQEKSEIGLDRFEKKKWKAIKIQAREIKNKKDRFT